MTSIGWFLISEMLALEYVFKSLPIHFYFFFRTGLFVVFEFAVQQWFSEFAVQFAVIPLYRCFSDTPDNVQYIFDHVLCVCAKVWRQSFLHQWFG
jgi:hypothetical protein